MDRKDLTVESAISSFGAAVTAKLSNIAAGGNPEDQIRAPFEHLVHDIAALSGRNNIVLIGESALAHLSLRPDYAVAINNALTGFVELKAPGKGADPAASPILTTSSKGRSSAHSQMFSSPTATHSAFGRKVNSSVTSLPFVETSKPPASSSHPRPVCSPSLKLS